MDLLGLDDLERHNWIRRWTDVDAPHPRTHLTRLSPRQMSDMRRPVERMADEVDELVRRGIIREMDVLMLRAMERGIGYMDFDRHEPKPSALSSVSRALVTETHSIPVVRDGNTLWVAMSEPGDAATADRYEFETGCQIIPVMAVPGAIDAMIERHYPEGG